MFLIDALFSRPFGTCSELLYIDPTDKSVGYLQLSGSRTLASDVDIIRSGRAICLMACGRNNIRFSAAARTAASMRSNPDSIPSK